MTVRFAITGSSGTGKSTLAMGAAKSLNVEYIEEAFRKRREAGLIFQELSRIDQSKLVIELYEESIKQLINCPAGFVQDRCPLDFLAFWLHYGFWSDEKVSHSLFERAQRDLSYYNRIILLPWGVFEIENDGVRSPNCWLQLKFQSLLEGLLNRLVPRDVIYWMPTNISSRKERIARVQEIAESTLNF